MRDKLFTACTFLFLTRPNPETGQTQVLLQLRQNTGSADGQYDLAAGGHVENGESMSQAIRREAKEEIGIDIPFDALELLLFVDVPSEGVYRGIFRTNEYTGIPEAKEPHKCGGLLWADVDELPENIIPVLPAVINHIMNGGSRYVVSEGDSLIERK